MNFKIEFSDTQFRLVLIASGEEEYLDPVLYCSVSTIVGPDGVTYGAYLSGSERDLDELTNNPDKLSMVSQSIKVYVLTAWPSLVAVPGSVTIEEVDFDNEDSDDEDDGEGDEGGDVVDVTPIP
jgi:hypothetical protein